ncbi:MAG: DUF1801 domain-containing protein [Phyllobacteriaceae bacterium]|nr:DUF1801 domain-containing protein [Phyllobacteriaceae bacterium]
MNEKQRLLSGGNPQIAKGYGQEVIDAYVAAMPGWKKAAGERIDAIVSREVPGVEKAVKWNSPFFGIERDSWFLSLHCFDKYIKLTFFQGASLEPQPKEKSKYPAVRYHHIHEGDDFDAQLAKWVRQAKDLPGEKL